MKPKNAALIGAIAILLFSLIPLGSVVRTLKIKKHGVLIESTVENIYKSSGKSSFDKVTASFTSPDGSPNKCYMDTLFMPKGNNTIG